MLDIIYHLDCILIYKGIEEVSRQLLKTRAMYSDHELRMAIYFHFNRIR